MRHRDFIRNLIFLLRFLLKPVITGLANFRSSPLRGRKVSKSPDQSHSILPLSQEIGQPPNFVTQILRTHTHHSASLRFGKGQLLGRQ